MISWSWALSSRSMRTLKKRMSWRRKPYTLGNNLDIHFQCAAPSWASFQSILCCVHAGNINQLILKMDSYSRVLKKTKGIVAEFVNPKYADNSKKSFKSPTRLECMMQDYPLALPPTANVGFTVINQVNTPINICELHVHLVNNNLGSHMFREIVTILQAICFTWLKMI